MAKRRRNLFEALGLARLPSIPRVCLLLVFTFLGLAFLSSLPVFEGSPLETLAVEGLKTVLAALLGSLSHLGSGGSRTRRNGGPRQHS